MCLYRKVVEAGRQISSRIKSTLTQFCSLFILRFMFKPTSFSLSKLRPLDSASQDELLRHINERSPGKKRKKIMKIRKRKEEYHFTELITHNKSIVKKQLGFGNFYLRKKKTEKTLWRLHKPSITSFCTSSIFISLILKAQ